MEKYLYATINIVMENKKSEIRIYKTKKEKFGIEIVSNIDSKEVVKTAENITGSEKKIESLLNTIVLSAQNFTLLEDFVYDFADVKLVV